MSEPLRPTPEQAIDALVVVVCSLILVVSSPFLFSFGLVAGAVATFAPVAWYLENAVIRPIVTSTPLEDPEISAAIRDTKVRTRVTESGGTRALDFWFWRAIVFNRTDVEGHYQNWRALVGHELSHLENGDVKYFHFVGLIGSIAIGHVIVSAAILTYAIVEQILNAASFAVPTSPFALLLPLSYALLILFFLFWVRQSLHDREYCADRRASEQKPGAIQDWLRRAERHQKKQPISWWRLSQNMSGWFTHPTFSKRRTLLATASAGSEIEFWGSLARSLVFFFGGPFLSFAVYTSLTAVFSSAAELLVGKGLSIIVLVLIPIGVGCAAITISVMSILERQGYVRAGLFCALIGVLVFAIVHGWSAFVQVLGFFDALTANLPPVPEDAQSSGYAEPLLAAMNYSILLFCQTILLKVVLRRRRYNVFAHAFLGACMLILAFLVVKIQYPLLFS